MSTGPKPPVCAEWYAHPNCDAPAKFVMNVPDHAANPDGPSTLKALCKVHFLRAVAKQVPFVRIG